MPSNVTMNDGTGTIKAVTKNITHDGDTAALQGISQLLVTGTEDAYTATDAVGGAGAVTAGTQRMTLASDDPAVVSLQLLDNAISGAGFNITQLGGAAVPIGGGVEATAVRVTLATDSTGVMSVDDNGGSLTIDGTVAATQSGAWTVDLGATDNAVLDAIAASLAGTLTVGSHAVTNAGTFAVQVSSALPTGTNSIGQVTANAGTNLNTSALALESGGNLASILTSVQLLDDSVYIDDADWTALTSKHTLIGGVYTSAARTITDGDTAPFSIDVNGHTIVSPHGASTALADNVSNTINLIVDQSNGFTAMATVGYMFDGSTWDRIRGTSADGLLVNLGTNNDVTITSGTVTTVTTVTTLSTLTGGAIAHDAADSGNPIKVGAKASATLSDDTMVANADRTDLTSDLDGAIIVRPQFPLGDLISERVSNTDGASTAFTNFGATASTRNYIYGYSIFRTDAGTTPIYVDFRDGTAGSILWSVVIPPNGGANLSSPVPLFRSTANTAVAFDVSAATTTVFISVNGCKSKV